ncbi:MAG: T9SS type A sorting domain-containing protein [Ferruginibacter sp.]
MNFKILFSTALIATSLSTLAQEANRTYAITGKADNKFFWSEIRQIDMTTGKVTRVVYENGKTPFVTDGVSSKINGMPAANNEPMAFGVAAAALDKENNRLYFTPMHFAQLRYVDLNSKEPKFNYLDVDLLKSPSGGYLTEESQITRMVISADGYGYGITNDANHLVRFSTAKKPVVEDLGNLVDADENKGVSIHNKCTSWGGDMIADAFGKLYVISANHNVFKVDPVTRIATHLGTIEGLPANFTSNGAVVDAAGKIVVSSANTFDGFYKFNLADLKAEKMPSSEPVYNASDLANGNLLLQKEADAARNTGRPVLQPVTVTSNDAVSVYPNPVTGTRFNVSISSTPGNYHIIVADLSGRALLDQSAFIKSKGQVVAVSFTKAPAKGTYLIKVVNSDNQSIYSDKIIVQ